jgi:hypothetical protein
LVGGKFMTKLSPPNMIKRRVGRVIKGRYSGPNIRDKIPRPYINLVIPPPVKRYSPKQNPIPFFPTLTNLNPAGPTCLVFPRAINQPIILCGNCQIHTTPYNIFHNIITIIRKMEGPEILNYVRRGGHLK